ncbi:MAG: phosphoribosyltransferase family protein, partial [Candidatus Absconditabacterales bacterium]
SPYRTSFGRTFQPFHVTFIPSHRYRKRFVKGYNQSELLARKLAVKLGLPSLQLVRKTKRTKSQAQLTRKQRLTNLQGAFSLKMNQLGTMNHELGTIFLVDDVTTTGSTLNQLAKVIKEKFPKIKVRGIVIARHMD